MDKYNIISMTTDIDELKADMARWCMLPYELRMRSIDDCRRLYNGMSVIDLYNHLKEMILKGEDNMNVEPDNLVRESVAQDYDNYEELLAQSKKIQESPYIVILDPDIRDIDELNNKYYSYYLLNDNNKTLSDSYSWKLWGRSIYSMYMTLAAEISSGTCDEEETYSSNIIRQLDESSVIGSIEEAIVPVYDFFNEAMMDHDIFSMVKYKESLLGPNVSVLETVVRDKKNVCKENSFDKSILPLCVPWFVASESTEMGKTLDVDKFYTVLKYELGKTHEESVEKTREMIQKEFAWNPAVPMTDKAREYARERQADFFNKVDIVNLKNLPVNFNINFKAKTELYPVFFVFGYKSPEKIKMVPEYTKVGIMLKHDIGHVYTFDGVENTFKGFKQELIYDYICADIVAAFLERDVYLKLLDNIANISNEQLVKFNFNSIFSVLSKTVNQLSIDNLKILYSRYIAMILKLINIDMNGKNIEVSPYCKINDKMNFFKVFSGPTTDFDRYEAEDILRKLVIISNNAPLEEAVKESLGGNSSEELLHRLTPIPCLIKIEE